MTTKTIININGNITTLLIGIFAIEQAIYRIFRKDPDTVSGNFRTAFRNYPDSITAYPDTLSNH